MKDALSALARRQLSEELARYVIAARQPRPRDGWIAAIRQALEMNVRQFAERLNTVASNAKRIEQREQNDTITLATLKRAADALGCDVVYALVPKNADLAAGHSHLLDALIATRAHAVASAEYRRTAHTMSLEDQAVSPRELSAQIAYRAGVLRETPRQLWNDVDAK